MNNQDLFTREAQKIHEKHIRQAESADVEIAKKRIDRYFKGKLQLTWKSIIYEINKLPELDRNKYLSMLVEEQATKARTQVFNELKKMTIIKYMKFRKDLKNGK